MDAGPQQHQAMDVDAADAQALAKQLRALDAKELLAVALDALKRDAALADVRARRAERRVSARPPTLPRVSRRRRCVGAA